MDDSIYVTGQVHIEGELFFLLDFTRWLPKDHFRRIIRIIKKSHGIFLPKSKVWVLHQDDFFHLFKNHPNMIGSNPSEKNSQIKEFFREEFDDTNFNTKF